MFLDVCSDSSLSAVFIIEDMTRPLIPSPSTYLKTDPYLKSHVGSPKIRFICAFKLPLFQAATKLPTSPILEDFFFVKYYVFQKQPQLPTSVRPVYPP